MKRLSDHERKIFNEAVKENRAIWDLSDGKHRKSDAVNAAWEKVAKETGKSVDECKKIYKSLRDSRRYKKKKITKSGSALDLTEPINSGQLVNDTVDEYEFDLSFIEENSSKRRTISTGLSDTPEIQEDASIASNYSYASTSNNKSKKKDDNEDDLLTTVVQKLVNLKKSKEIKSLQYLDLHTTMDRLYSQLESTEVEILHNEFYNKDYAKVMEKNKTIN